MWRKALTFILRPTKDEWTQLSLFTKWLIATRAAVLIITFLPCVLVGFFAYREEGYLNFGLWGLMTLGFLLAHATNNILNDIVDWKRGVDKDNYFRNQYAAHLMQLMTTNEVAGHLFATGLSALLIGIYFIYLRGCITFYITSFCSFFLLFYTYPLKYIGLGEISVFLVWGVLMFGGGFHALTNQWSWKVVFMGLPMTLGITTIIFGKHIDKLKLDEAKKIYTLPVLLGDVNARMVATLLLSLQYVVIVFGVIFHIYPSYFLVVFGAFPRFIQAAKVFTNPAPPSCPPNYPKHVWPLWFVAHAFKHNAIFGTLFVIGFILDAIFGGI